MGKHFSEKSEEQKGQVIKTNLLGTTYAQTRFFKEMKNTSGHIINVSYLAVADIPPDSHMSSFTPVTFGFPEAILTERELWETDNVKLTWIRPHVTNSMMFDNVQGRWPLFYPEPEPEWVAEQIVIATKEEKDQLTLPRFSLPIKIPQVLKDFTLGIHMVHNHVD